MTRAITSDELNKIRGRQWTRWYAIVDAPNTIYSATASGSINKADWTIPFSGGSGTLSDCLADMTLLIGSSAGGWDRGVARLRKSPIAGTFYIGADDSLRCYSGDYLTVINDFAPSARHPVGESMDVDVAYVDQFSAFAPTPVMGERVAVIQAGQTIGFDASASWVIGSSISGYAWQFPGASNTSGTTTATPTATYNSSGRYRVQLTVTAANGRSSVGYGWVYVIGASLQPEANILVDKLEGDADRGWSCRVRMLDRPTIRDRARIVLYAEDYYGDEKISLGPSAGRENLLMIGWIIGETITRRPGSEWVEFDAGGPGGILSSLASLPAGLTDKRFPTDEAATLPPWARVQGLTISKGLHYLLHYRSTLPVVMDVEVEDWNWAAHKLTANADDLWGQLRDFAESGLLACLCDRYGHLYIQRDAALYPLTQRSNIPVVMTLSDADWHDDLSVRRRQMGDAALVELEGYVYANRKAIPTGGRSPGDQPASFGDVEGRSEIAWPNQTTALECAGLMAGALNAEYESITATLPANNRFIDVAPRQYLTVTVDGDAIRCIPRRVIYYRDEDGIPATTVDMEAEGGQWPAKAIEYPNESTPPIENPPTPPTPPPPPPGNPPPPEAPGTGNAVVVVVGDVRTTADLSATNPTWATETPPASGIVDSALDGTTLYLLYENGLWKGEDILATGAPSWTQVLSSGSYPDLASLKFLRVVATSVHGLIYVLGANGADAWFFRSASGGAAWSEPELIAAGAIPTSSQEYSYDGNCSLVSSYYATTPEAPLSPGGHPVNGPRATLLTANEMFAQAWAIYDIGRPLTLSSLTWWWHADGDDIVEISADGSNWTRIWYSRYSWASNIVEVRTQTFTPQTVRYVKFLVERVVGVGNRIDLAWFYFDGGPVYPTAIDAARTNPGWIYVGTQSKIFKSENGGFDWITLLSDRGANDIHVDPQLAGAVYAWDSNGNLVLIVAGVVTSVLDTETPTRKPLRLARDLNSGRLWALKGGTTLRMRNLATWTDQKTGLVGGRGLHAYLGQKLIFLDANNIWVSDDGGTTVTGKKGGWTGYASPINGHRMP